MTLSDPTASTPTFTAPIVSAVGASLKFQLVVNDGVHDSNPSQVTITVQNVNDPPRCDLAQPSLSTLWPPNHNLNLISIRGMTDPNNEDVVISTAGVTQDEPTTGLGDDDSSPDAVIAGSAVWLRAERAEDGNGRVYRVGFTANDGQGGSCSGFVNVTVPHDIKPATPAVDSGHAYDSTQP